MSFGRAIQNQNSEALMEFATAQVQYKKACSLFTRIRYEMVGSMNSDESVIRYHRARIVYKEECRVYALARAKYIASVRRLGTQLPRVTNEEILDECIGTNERAITEQIRKDALMRSITPEEIAIVRQAHEDREAARTPRFVPTTDDPTCGDFDPL